MKYSFDSSKITHLFSFSLQSHMLDTPIQAEREKEKKNEKDGHRMTLPFENDFSNNPSSSKNREKSIFVSLFSFNNRKKEASKKESQRLLRLLLAVRRLVIVYTAGQGGLLLVFPVSQNCVHAYTVTYCF